MSNKRIVYYVNQFFGQLGGEEKADLGPEYREEAVGPAAGFQGLLKDEADVVGTIICGDNYFNEKNDDALAFILNVLREQKPDVVVAGPAFLAGRYGMACIGVCKAAKGELGVPVVTGMHEENPGVDLGRGDAIIVKTGGSAADMRRALPKMAQVVRKICRGEAIRPDEDGYFAQGIRDTVFADKRGSVRAVEMLLARLHDEPYKTELPMPTFDSVDPAAPIADLSHATIALVTSGGIVPNGNPDHLQSASAQQWNKYDITGQKTLKGGYCTIHGGFDPVYANDDANRVIPLNVLSELKDQGVIGDIYQYFYTTTGTGTSVANGLRFGREIGRELKEAGVDGVLLTST
ncbi:putative glycine reductase, B [Olsenella profusa F0195]|uniref:Putative glycine reductase, B n=2 Tax=Olsenella profusa TaxID=138595 RepID=U2UYT7_9ACTN|nr:putative glycine reductase, B [Olsenella profusa F0195]